MKNFAISTSHPPAIDPRALRPWIVLGCVALALRAGFVLLHPSITFGPFDPTDYEKIAASIASGHGFPPSAIATPGTPSAYRPPAYPYLLGAAYAMFGVHPTVGRLVGALLGTVSVLLVAWLGSLLWGRRIGLFSGGIAAICPSLIVLNGSLLSESLFIPFELGIAISVTLILKRAPSYRLVIACGALCGLAALTRSIGLIFLAPAIAAIAITPSIWRDRARQIGALMLATAVVLTPCGPPPV